MLFTLLTLRSLFFSRFDDIVLLTGYAWVTLTRPKLKSPSPCQLLLQSKLLFGELCATIIFRVLRKQRWLRISSFFKIISDSLNLGNWFIIARWIKLLKVYQIYRRALLPKCLIFISQSTLESLFFPLNRCLSERCFQIWCFEASSIKMSCFYIEWDSLHLF